MNKKGDFELSSQMVLWIPKILLFILAVAIILGPVGCYTNRNVEDGNAESFIVMKKAVYCLEKYGFDKLNNCMKQERYGIKISNNDREIIFNKDKYLDKTFCDYVNYFCRDETIRIGDKEFLIEVVVKNE
jgi:hypothetical protein